MEINLWTEPKYQELVVLIISFLCLTSFGVYLFSKLGGKSVAAWASIKSWWLFAPFMLIGFGFPSPWPLILLVLTGIYSIKLYFQMVGIYHRSWFVWLSYFFIISLGVCIEYDNIELFNLMPMIFLGTASFIPLLRNSTNHMVQYIALSLLGFVFFGWSFLYLGLFLNLEHGVYLIIYIYILAEIAENASLMASNFIGRHKLFKKISNRVSIEGFVVSLLFSLTIAWALRHLLPVRSEPYWITAGFISAIVGRFGSLFLSVIRRDLGLKNTGIFIIGRGDIIDRMDKYIFIGPVFYYAFLYLNRTLS